MVLKKDIFIVLIFQDADFQGLFNSKLSKVPTQSRVQALAKDHTPTIPAVTLICTPV